MSARADVLLDQGAGFRAEVQVLGADGSPQDVSAWVCNASFTSYPGANSGTQANCCVASGNGVVVFSLTPDQVVGLDRPSGVWDLYGTDTSNNVVRVVGGRYSSVLKAQLPFQQNEPDANTAAY